jgi:hypothetical protein
LPRAVPPMERILQLLDDFDDLLAVVRQRLRWFP